MNRKYTFLLVGLFFLTLISCEEKKSIYPLVSANTFFDFQKDVSLIFSGDSIIYNNFTNTVDTVSFQYKDSLIAIDTVGEQIAYQFERYIAYPPLFNYQYFKNYTLTKGKIGIIHVEDLSNKLVLPSSFEVGTKWNGNQYQLGDPKIYSITSIKDSTLNGANRKCVEVFQENEVNLIEEKISKEIYAVGLGMIYRNTRNVSKDISTGVIKSGSIVNLVFKP